MTPSILAWQPIAGPSLPASYSLEQAHPAGIDDIGSEVEGRIISGNKFLEQNIDAPDYSTNDAYKFFGGGSHSGIPVIFDHTFFN